MSCCLIRVTQETAAIADKTKTEASHSEANAKAVVTVTKFAARLHETSIVISPQLNCSVTCVINNAANCQQSPPVAYAFAFFHWMLMCCKKVIKERPWINS